MSVCTCMSECVRDCAHAHACTHVSRPEVSLACCSSGAIYFIIFEAESLFGTWGSRLSGLDGKLQGTSCLHLCSEGIPSVHHHAWLLHPRSCPLFIFSGDSQ